MNYTVSTKTKRVYADMAKLTDEEKMAISLYIQSGYELKPKIKRKNNNIKANKVSIYHYFAANKDAEGLKKFEANCNRKRVDKNGTNRKGGFLYAKNILKEDFEAKGLKFDIEEVAELSKEEAKWIEENK